MAIAESVIKLIKIKARKCGKHYLSEKTNLQPEVYSRISHGLKATGAEVLYFFSDTRGVRTHKSLRQQRTRLISSLALKIIIRYKQDYTLNNPGRN